MIIQKCFLNDSAEKLTAGILYSPSGLLTDFYDRFVGAYALQTYTNVLDFSTNCPNFIISENYFHDSFYYEEYPELKSMQVVSLYLPYNSFKFGVLITREMPYFTIWMKTKITF